MSIRNRIGRLRAALRQRDTKTAFEILKSLSRSKEGPAPGTTESFVLLLQAAECCDLGFGDHNVMNTYLSPFRKLKRQNLVLSCYLNLRLAEAYLLFAENRFTEASDLLGSLLRAHSEVLQPHAQFLAWLWRGRAQHASGSFDEALTSIVHARQISRDRGFDKLEATAKIHESWLLFYRGDRKKAFNLLDEAESVLLPTNHALSLGNIAASRGRYHRHAGDYRRSIECFDQAISAYRSQVPNHPDLARALVHAAYAKRLQALQLQPVRGGKASSATHTAMLKVVREAMEMLHAARDIYTVNRHSNGLASVAIHLGHLYLESGEIEAATHEAEAVIKLAEEKNDPTLQARAHILGAYVEMTRSEEQLESSWYSGSPAQHAIDLAQKAIEFSRQTKNRRLVAAAHITQGLAATDPLHSNWDLALRSSATANELLGSDERDHLFSELTILRKRISESQNLDSIWRRWCSGDIEGASYQEIEEQFAALVIPQVWTKLGENVSAVARHLRISPKKVRRALKNAKQ
jgi:tetratricopeptide (TPR) repeat protein